MQQREYSNLEAEHNLENVFRMNAESEHHGQGPLAASVSGNTVKGRQQYTTECGIPTGACDGNNIVL